VQVIKTHFPEKRGNIMFTAERALLITRNPLDTMVSLFNLIATASHDLSVLDSDFELFKQNWQERVKLEIPIWNKFYEYWLNKKDIPVHVVRYEDIKEDPYTYMKGVLEFVLEVDDISGTKVHRYLQMVVASK